MPFLLEAIQQLFVERGVEPPTFTHNDPWLTVSSGGQSRQLRPRDAGESLEKYLRYTLGHCRELLPTEVTALERVNELLAEIDAAEREAPERIVVFEPERGDWVSPPSLGTDELIADGRATPARDE